MGARSPFPGDVRRYFRQPNLIDNMWRPIPSSELGQRYRQLVANSFEGMKEEFKALSIRDESWSVDQARKACNKDKNRYVNILPYDHTRFILQTIVGNEGSDYINANYVSGFFGEKEYIATQAPLKNTTNDFWRMCWESGSKCILMLTRCAVVGPKVPPWSHEFFTYHLKSKRDQEHPDRYWPGLGKSQTYGLIKVTMIGESVSTFQNHTWIISDLIMCFNGRERKVRHYLAKTWSESDAVHPPAALLKFVRDVRFYSEYPTPETPGAPPIVIHCTAGIGRTGTFIAADILINQIKHNAVTNIPRIISKLRDERTGMVQSKPQYVGLYKCGILFITAMEAEDSRRARAEAATAPGTK